jgi:hypothetical protein
MNLKSREIKILPQLSTIPNFQVLFLFVTFRQNISDKSSPLFRLGKARKQSATSRDFH